MNTLRQLIAHDAAGPPHSESYASIRRHGSTPGHVVPARAPMTLRQISIPRQDDGDLVARVPLMRFDRSVGRRLWSVSGQLTGVTFPLPTPTTDHPANIGDQPTTGGGSTNDTSLTRRQV